MIRAHWRNWHRKLITIAADTLTLVTTSATKRGRLFTTQQESVKKCKQMQEIVLNRDEEKLTSLLHAASCHISSANSSSPLVIRYAGGWVRDKLLGYESNDLDVVVNSLTGYDFAVKFAEYLSKNCSGEGNCTVIAKIASNPEKSKHLETATTSIFGLDLDFVNLRSEEYADNSRIPDMVY